MMRFLFFSIAFLSLMSNSAFGQRIVDADEYYQAKYYPEAIALFEELQASKDDSTRRHAQVMLAMCYYKLHDYPKAFKQFKTAQVPITKVSREQQQTWIRVLQNLEMYDEASDYISRLDLIDTISILPKFQNNKPLYRTTLVPTNSGISFMGLAHQGDEVLIAQPNGDEQEHTDGYDLYRVKKLNDSLLDLSSFEKIIEQKGKQMYRGNPSIMNDSLLLFTQNVAEKKWYRDRNKLKNHFSESGQNLLHLYQYNLQTKRLVALDELNEGAANSVTPHFVTAHNTLLFSSDREGSEGGYDIYYTRKTKQGWGTPKRVIGLNTTWDEVYPFVFEDKIYFSSRGHQTMGGLDVFEGTIEWEDGVPQVTNIQNMNAPVNSSKDDFGLYWLNRNSGYLASNKEGKNGKDDLYFIRFVGLEAISGIVVDDFGNTLDAQMVISRQKKDGSWEPLDTLQLSADGAYTYEVDFREKYRFDVSKEDFQSEQRFFPNEQAGDLREDSKKYFEEIELTGIRVEGLVTDAISEKPIPGTTISIYEMQNGERLLKDSLKTDEDGNWIYNFDRNTEYEVDMEARGYDRKTFEIPDIEDERNRNQFLEWATHAELNPEAKEDDIIRINNIYFDFDAASIREDSYPILDNVVKFLQLKPEIKIELSAHTDCVGSKSYNLNLSNKRAKSCFEYLVGKGIAKDRLISKGYGEEHIINGCIKPGQCSTEENEVNRRIEIKVL